MISVADIRRRVHINIPFAALADKYLERFLAQELNPEIAVNAETFRRFSTDDVRAVADRLKERGLSVTLHGPFLDLSPGSPDPDVRRLTRRRFEQTLGVAPLFRPRTVVCHAGYDWKRYGYIRDAWIEHSMDTWSWLNARLRDEGAALVLENVYERGPEEIRIFFETLGAEGLRFCMDVGHQTVFGDARMEDWLRVLGPYLGEVHLHDNFGERDDHLGLGKGGIDFTPVLARLGAADASFPVVTVEAHQEDHVLPSLEYLAARWPGARTEEKEE